MHPRAQKILELWFGDLDHTPAYFRERNRFWFMGGEKADDLIRLHFSADVEDAAAGRLESWRVSPKGTLALIVLLDQFSLNLYRTGKQGYLCSEMAIPLAKQMVQSGWTNTLSPAEKIFVYMPLEHSEHLHDQEVSVRLFRELFEQSPAELKPTMEGSLQYAERHLAVVKEFGRFPHRNEALGRVSRPEEIAFLASSRAPF
jgi:uncharacterized protein (DUF924 family)